MTAALAAAAVVVQEKPFLLPLLHVHGKFGLNGFVCTFNFTRAREM